MVSDLTSGNKIILNISGCADMVRLIIQTNWDGE